jgi:hypothetical protein
VPALLLAACDTAPGPTPLAERPPVLSELAYTPQVVVLEQVPDQVEGDLVRIPISINVRADDEDGDLDAVRYVVQSPLAGSAPLAAGELGPSGPLQYGGNITVEIPTAEVGRYTLMVYAEDRAGQLSNQVRGTLRFEATGKPPVIEDVEMPETVQRPAEGEPPVAFQIIATVSDPDGLNNIQRVELRNVLGGPALELCDTGPDAPCGGIASSGDAVAGDGRFTLTVQVESANAPGENTFAFQAFDRSNLESEVVLKSITVQ